MPRKFIRNNRRFLILPQITSQELNRTFAKSRKLSLPQAEGGKTPVLQYFMLAALVILIAVAAAKMLAPKQVEDQVKVVAAGQDIAPGCKIDFNSLHYMIIPRRYYTSGMIPSYENVVGKVSREYIRKGNPILNSDMLDRQSLSLVLKPEMRAFTLKLEPEMQVDHSIKPGDKVDVIVTSTAKGPKSSKKYTKTVCENLTVLLSSPKTIFFANSAKTSEANKITLAASASDCEKLSQAIESGKVRLSLRNPGDLKMGLPAGSDERDLIPAYALKEMAEEELAAQTKASPLPAFIPPPAPPPPPPLAQAAPPAPLEFAQPLQWVVEMFSGSKKENYVIPAK